MEARQRTRSCDRESTPHIEKPARGSKQIVIPMLPEVYEHVWDDPVEVRRIVELQIVSFPELFPEGIQDGFQLSGHLPESKKMPGVRLRQLRLRNGDAYTLRPSFVMPYMMGNVDDLDGPLLLLSIGTPCWILTRIFGRNDMYWYRLLERLGRNNLVGTTVRNLDRLPEHLAGDENHTDWFGIKGFISFVAAGGCILGIALTQSADEEHLKEAYGKFAQECRDVKPDYAPKTVNTDGWTATQNAFTALFSSITVILCFLHGFLKIRDRCRKARELHARVWEVYRAETATDFRRRMAAFQSWFETGTWTKPVREMVAKLCNRCDEYAESYSHPGCYRTSNQVDRLMNRLTRFTYAGRGLHGHQRTSELRLRGWALLQNFRPYAPRSNQQRTYRSPVHRLNQKEYHPHWLHNLQLSASLMGYKRCT